MAAANQLRSLKDDATCSICLEYFTDPVFVECGHTFCLSCITRYWEGRQTDFLCPQCREISQSKTFRPNRDLVKIVETLKRLDLPSATPQEANLCQEHEEKLKLFCEDDQEPICVVCSMSRDHKQHRVHPIRDAAQEYKEKFQRYLDGLKKELEDIHELHCKEETQMRQLEVKFKNQREQITNEFEKLQMFIENEKSCLLSNLEEKEKKSLKIIKESLTKLEKEESVLGTLIKEIESKCQQQDVEILKGVRSMLGRYENMKPPLPGCDPSKEKEEETDEEKKEVDLQINIIKSLEWRWARRFAAAVTLDPDTAHRELILSKAGSSVRHGDKDQDLPDTPERFNNYILVLGRERLSSGRHYWEVEVGYKTVWVLGVCDESASRKGKIILTPEDGYWTVRLRDGEYEALTDPSTLLTPHVPPRAVGLFLDYEAGKLSVYNVHDRSLLFCFFGPPFPHTLRPFFCPGTNEGGRNAGALRIWQVTGQE